MPDPTTTIKTTMLLIPVLGPIEDMKVDLSLFQKRPSLTFLQLREFIDDGPEHVTVLYNGAYRDMFVGETSAINGKHLVNVRATEIYRNNTLTHVPGTDPFSLPAIHGPAVLFPYIRVWV